jgi:hypothetical protein
MTKYPIHPLSAGLLVAIDGLWFLDSWIIVAWIFTIPLSFLSVLIPTYLIQRHLNQDGVGKALAIASLLAVLAAIPTPIAGGTVGMGILALAGLRSITTTANKQ